MISPFLYTEHLNVCLLGREHSTRLDDNPSKYKSESNSE